MNIELRKDELYGWAVYVDGELLMECLSDTEVEELTIKEIKELNNKGE